MTQYLGRFRYALLLGAALLLFAGRPDPAAAECQALDFDETIRDCTFTESVGECFWNALISYEQCFDGEPWYMIPICVAALDIDFAACGVAALREFIIG